MVLQPGKCETNSNATRCYLIEVRVRLRLSHALEVFHVDELEVIEQAGIGRAELWQQLHMR